MGDLFTTDYGYNYNLGGNVENPLRLGRKVFGGLLLVCKGCGVWVSGV
jgi:hypothetical protein